MKNKSVAQVIADKGKAALSLARSQEPMSAEDQFDLDRYDEMTSDY